MLTGCGGSGSFWLLSPPPRLRQLFYFEHVTRSDALNKLRQLSKQEKVSATEIVRRAIDAYDPAVDGELTAQEEGAVVELLGDIHARTRAVLERIDADSAEWRKRMTALQDGSLREKVRLETEEFFRKHPDALQGIDQLFGSH